MGVKFIFGQERVNLKHLTLIHGGSFQRRRELLISIYALFRMLSDIRDGNLSERLRRSLSFKEKRKEKGIIRIGLIDLEELTRALNTMYRNYLVEFLLKNLGYVPPVIPDLVLTSHGIQALEIELNPGWAGCLRYINSRGKRKGSIAIFSDLSEFASLEDILQELIIDVFVDLFFKQGKSFSRFSEPLYFPVERLCLSEKITEPIEIPEECRTIRDFVKTIKEQVLSQVSPVCGLAEDFIERNVAPSMIFSRYVDPYPLKENFLNTLLYGGKVVFTEDLIPAYVKNGKVIPLKKAKMEIRDMAFIFTGIGYLCRSSRPGLIFIEDIDIYKSPDYQMLLMLLLETFLEDGSLLIISAEGEYFPSIVDTYMVENGNRLCGLYSIDGGSQV